MDEELSLLNAEFAIQQFQRFIHNSNQFKNKRLYSKEINESAGTLTNKTLLVPENLTDYSEESLNSWYNEKIKIVSEKEVRNAVNTQDTAKAYLLITINDISDKPSVNHLIVDCATNEPILIYRNSSAYSMPFMHTCVKYYEN